MRKTSYRQPTIILIILAIILVVGNGLTAKSRSTSPDLETVVVTRDTLQEINRLNPPTVSVPQKPEEKTTIYAKAYIVTDGATKYPLAAKDADTPVPIASTTKIMTSLVAMDLMDLDDVVTVSSEAATIPGSEIQLMTGETITVKNLLYALLINSANDAAYALANGSGSKQNFIAKMNEKARMLGLDHTQYQDPAGLDDTGYSTPRDLANLTHYALNNPLFRDIVRTSKYTVWSADSKYKHDLTNSNRLVVPEEPLFYTNAIGVKTGFTLAAGHCLVAASEYGDGKRLVAVVLNTVEQSKEASAREARGLLIWAAQSYENHSL